MRSRDPWPIVTINFPPENPVILPLMILPSLRRMVSAKAATERIAISKNEISVRIIVLGKSSYREEQHTPYPELPINKDAVGKPSVVN